MVRNSANNSEIVGKSIASELDAEYSPETVEEDSPEKSALLLTA
jgi:hypothetical protein